MEEEHEIILGQIHEAIGSMIGVGTEKNEQTQENVNTNVPVINVAPDGVLFQGYGLNEVLELVEPIKEIMGSFPKKKEEGKVGF